MKENAHKHLSFPTAASEERSGDMMEEIVG